MAGLHRRRLATPDAAVPYPGYVSTRQGWPRYAPAHHAPSHAAALVGTLCL